MRGEPCVGSRGSGEGLQGWDVGRAMGRDGGDVGGMGIAIFRV